MSKVLRRDRFGLPKSASRLFEGGTGRRIADALASELTAVLLHIDADGARRAALLVPLVASQIAGAMLGLLKALIAGRSAAAPDEIAHLLWAGTRSLAHSGE